jgi:transcriptional regulator with XRE-family HTH domain
VGIEKQQREKLTPNELIAVRLRTWRTAKGLPLKAVAKEFGVSEATWNRWEQGNRFPSPAFVTLLSDFISLPVCRFFYEADLPCPSCPLNQTAQRKKESAKVH